MIGFGGSQNQTPISELPDVFPFPVLLDSFMRSDLENIYARILTDVLERTQGIPDETQPLLWDNCVASESPDGLVTMISKAMVNQAELFIVYDKGVKVIRKATATEETQIKADYKAKGESAAGVYITFKNYKRTEMLKIYSGLEFCAVAGLHKSMNLSKAVQFKIHELRGSVAVADSAQTNAQASAVANALKNGKDVAIDAKDIIETSKPDLTATNSAMEFINQKKSLYLGLPATYITGESAKGLGDSGEGDAKAVERGLKNYYFSIVKPVVEAIFGVDTDFETEDYASISSSLEVLKTFELTSNELISQENKQLIVNRVFGLPEDAEGDAPAEPVKVPPAAVVPPAKPVTA